MVTASSSSPQLSGKQDNDTALDTHTLVPCCILVKFQETRVRDKESVPGAASNRSWSLTSCWADPQRPAAHQLWNPVQVELTKEICWLFKNGVMFVFYRQLSENGYVFTDSESTGRTPAPPPPPPRIFSADHNKSPNYNSISTLKTLSSLRPPMLALTQSLLAAWTSCDMWTIGKWTVHIWAALETRLAVSMSRWMQSGSAQVSIRRPKAWFWKMSLPYRWVTPATRSAFSTCIKIFIRNTSLQCLENNEGCVFLCILYGCLCGQHW